VPLVTRAVEDVSPALVDQLLEHGRQLQWDELVAEALAKPGAGPESTLTRREHEIAGLVAQGLTNVQIADELVISRRTVESHIGHIRQKLGVSSRNKIIVWVLQESSSARGS
jgi:DNA-binding CsgD family transcriptional regulator